MTQNDFNALMRDPPADEKTKLMLSPLDVIDRMKNRDPGKAKMLEGHLSELSFKFILNQFRRHTDENLGQKIEKVCNKHFYSKFEFLGNINYDDKVYDSISSKKIYCDIYPFTVTATHLRYIAEKMIRDGGVLTETSYQGHGKNR